jgi:DNA uptake protein ComE-like DNA-binding protein
VLSILNQYANLIVAGVAGVSVVVMIFYVVFTWRLVRETIKTREADLRPYIFVDTTMRGQRFYLVIRNAGRSPAEKVRFTFDKSVENMWTRKIEEVPLFKNGIEILLPGKEYAVSLGPHWLFLNKDVDTRKYPAYFSIDVEYSYFQGIRNERKQFVINLEEYRNTERFPDELVKTVETLSSSINSQLKSIADNMEKLATLEAIVRPSGLEISQGTTYRFLELLDKEAKEHIKLDLNLATLSELIQFLDIEPSIAEKVLERRYSIGYFKSYEDIKGLKGMTDELLDKFQRKTIIYNPNF